jgi:glycosyltransferase involved in cell wall biosynthesis
MTRVLVIHNRYRSSLASGENRVVEQEIALLRAAGHEVSTYVRDSDDIARSSLGARMRLPLRVVWSENDRREVEHIVRNRRPEVAHVHNTFPLISPSVVHGLADSRIPIVMTLHNYRLFCANGALFRDGRPCEDCLGSSPMPGLVHACYRQSRAATAPITMNIAVHRQLGTWNRVAVFVSLSTFARDKVVAAGLPQDRMAVKPNFVWPPEPRPESGRQHVLFLGRLTKEKGADLLLSAWSSTFGRLVVAGDGPERPRLEDQAMRHGESVRFVGARSTAECADLLAAARLLVVPSRAYEGFPMVVAEAYAHGVPVIAPAHGAFPEIVQDGSTGYLFRSGDPVDLARAIQRGQGPAHMSDIVEAARHAYETLYTPERNLAALEAIYERARSGMIGTVARGSRRSGHRDAMKGTVASG